MAKKYVLVGCWVALMFLPQLVSAPAAKAATVPAGRATVIVVPDPFKILWTVSDANALVIPMRLGRHRAKPSLYGDGYDNFGLDHVQHGHVGVDKDWSVDALMTAQVRRAIQQPNGIYPDPYKGSNKKEIHPMRRTEVPWTRGAGHRHRRR